MKNFILLIIAGMVAVIVLIGCTGPQCIAYKTNRGATVTSYNPVK